MPLFGTLSTMPLPDLLQWLGAARRTGTLKVERNRVRKLIVMRDGNIVGCSSDDPPERLGHFLLSRGKITEDQLRVALAAQEGSGNFLGRIFVDMGAFPADELDAHLQAKAEETIYSVFDWHNAVFRFHEEVTESPNISPVDLRVEEVLLRGMQRLDELERARTVINDPGIVLRRTDKTPPQDFLDNHMARTLYEAIDGDRTVAEIVLHVHGSEYLVTKFLYELHRSGYVDITGVKPVERDAAPPAAEPIPAIPAEPAATAEAPPQAAAIPVQPTPVGAVAPAAPLLGAPQRAAAAELLDVPEVFGERGLDQARAAMAEADYETALEILNRLYHESPNDPTLEQMTAEAEKAFIEKAYMHYLPPDRLIALTNPGDLETQSFSPSEFFLLSRIDGTWDVKSIIQIAPLREVEALITLKRMREKGVIELSDPETTKS